MNKTWILVFLKVVLVFGGEIQLFHKDFKISEKNITEIQTLAQTLFVANDSGTVLARFQGNCFFSAGDQVVFAINTEPKWEFGGNLLLSSKFFPNRNDGNRFFSNSKVFRVGPGVNRLYAMVQAVIRDGDYSNMFADGIFTVEFFPDNNKKEHFIKSTRTSSSNINLRNNIVPIGELSLNTAKSGKVIVHFDGVGETSQGDLVALDISKNKNKIQESLWELEAPAADLEANSFSIKKVFDVQPGTHDFYVNAVNRDKKDGDGKATFYGNLTLKFIAEDSDAKIATSKFHEFAVELSEASPSEMMAMGLEVANSGKVILDYSGMLDFPQNTRVTYGVSMSGTQSPNGTDSIQNYLDLDPVYFSRRRVMDVEAGLHTFKWLMSAYNWESDLTTIYETKASMIATFLPDHNTSSLPSSGKKIKALFKVLNNQKDRISIELLRSFNNPIKLKLLDPNGRILGQFIQNQKTPGLLAFKAPGIGLYFVHFQAGKWSEVQPVVFR